MWYVLVFRLNQEIGLSYFLILCISFYRLFLLWVSSADNWYSQRDKKEENRESDTRY